MSELDIGVVARLSGFPPSKLRYYEERGLIRSIGRQGLRRVFDSSVLQRLTLITLGQEAGFSLAEIVQMFSLDGSPRIDRNKLLAKAEEIYEAVRRLTAMQNGLRHAAACPAPSHMECPSFQKILRAVAKRNAGSNRRIAQHDRRSGGERRNC